MMATVGHLGAALLPPPPLPAAQQPAAALHAQAQQQARLDAYRKVVRIFMQGAYDLVRLFRHLAHKITPALVALRVVRVLQHPDCAALFKIW